MALLKYRLVSCISFSPCYFADRPTEVKLGIYVNSFYSINEQTMVCEDCRVSPVSNATSYCTYTTLLCHCSCI